MRAPSFVRSISSKLSMSRRSKSLAVVVPLLEQSRFSEEVTAQIDALKSPTYEFGSSSWLVDVLDATISTQIVAQECLSNASTLNLSDVSKEMINDYLEDNVELLDACNSLVEKMGMIRECVDLLRVIMRLVEPSVMERTHEHFKKCGKLEEECTTLDKCSPKLNKLMGQKGTQMSTNVQDQELQEALIGSKEVASMGCHLLQRALSFKSRQGSMKMKSKLPTAWSCSLNELQNAMNEEVDTRKSNSSSWMMKELEQMVMDAKKVYDRLKFQNVKIDVDSLKRSCEAVEEGIRPLEDKVSELYKHLISFRMALLGTLSQN